jgi:hypothetical protein
MTHLKNTALMKLLVELLAIPLGYPKTVTKWLVISNQKTLANWLVIGCQKALHSQSTKQQVASRWLTPAKSLVILFAALALSAALSGCGKSGTPPAAADETNKLCGAIIDTGLTKQCVVSNRNNTVGVVIDTNDEAARSLCVDIANKMKPLTADLTGQWKLQIFSPYRDDKPLAYCVLQ